MRFTGSGPCGPVAIGMGAALVLTAALGTAAAASGESGGGGVTVIPDGSVVIQIANFLLLIFILNILLYRPIRKILSQRKEKIHGLELSIETSNSAVEEKDRAIAQGIKDARAKGMKEKDALLQEAADEEKRVLAQINERAQAEIAGVRTRIAGDVENAREALSRQVDEFANIISQKILGRTVS